MSSHDELTSIDWDPNVANSGVEKHAGPTSHRIPEPNQGLRRHKLLPADVRKALPALYATENSPEARAVVRFFSPYSGAEWFAFEFDGEDTFFGWAEMQPGCGEFGYFSFLELASASRSRLPLVERDRYPGTLPTKAELR